MRNDGGKNGDAMAKSRLTPAQSGCYAAAKGFSPFPCGPCVQWLVILFLDNLLKENEPRNTQKAQKRNGPRLVIAIAGRRDKPALHRGVFSDSSWFYRSIICFSVLLGCGRNSEDRAGCFTAAKRFSPFPCSPCVQWLVILFLDKLLKENEPRNTQKAQKKPEIPRVLRIPSVQGTG